MTKHISISLGALTPETLEEPRDDQAPPADDRRDGEAPTMGRPYDAAALEALWAYRDAQYTEREHPLTPREIAGIREFRLLEVKSLRPAEQVGTNLATRAMTWVPPR